MADYADRYKNPLYALIRKQFYTGGCGHCVHHRLRPDRKKHHCADGWEQWPNGTQKSCRGFVKKKREVKK